MYDLALREWERIGYVSDRPDSPFVYYHLPLNEWRLDRYLVTLGQLSTMTEGGWHLFESDQKANSGWRDLGEIIGCKTEGVEYGDFQVEVRRTPGYWIVLNLGQIDIYPGSVSRKPITVDTNAVGD